MIQFEKVTRKKSKARIALEGPSGAGKTLSALFLAKGIVGGDWSKVALIDTEHERARFYAERADLGIGQFLYAAFYPPYTPERYKELVNSAAQAVGENGVVIVDSFSHAWAGEGGVLDIKSEIEKNNSNKNSFSAWNEAGKIQNNLVDTILSVPCHTIATLRTKMGYATEVNERGKVVPVKIGLEPVQRDNVEYEFDIVIQINQEHVASASKDTTFLDDWSGIITPGLGEQLAQWLDKGEEPVRCAECKRAILPTPKFTVAQIVERSNAKFGKVLCAACAQAAVKAAQNAAETVSE